MNVRQLTPDELARLAANPDNIVHRYVDTPAAPPPALDSVLAGVRDLWVQYQQQNPRTPEEAQAFQATLLRKRRWREFQSRHEHVWRNLTRTGVTAKEVRAIEHLIELMRRHRAGQLSDEEGKTAFGDYMVRNFGVPEAQYQREHPDIQTVSLPGAAP
jgi:hypothetical protein